MGISLNKKCQSSSCVLLYEYSIYWVFTNKEIHIRKKKYVHIMVGKRRSNDTQTQPFPYHVFRWPAIFIYEVGTSWCWLSGMEMDLYKSRFLDGHSDGIWYKNKIVQAGVSNCMRMCLICFGTKRTHSFVPGLKEETLLQTFKFFCSLVPVSIISIISICIIFLNRHFFISGHYWLSALCHWH